MNNQSIPNNRPDWRETFYQDVEHLPGTVTVTIAPDVSVEKAWEALTEPDTVSHWFGSLSSPLQTGGATRLDFGDGDFFEIQDIQLVLPDLVQYAWRFMGTGPLNWITWHLQPEGRGCRVTVIDSQAERSREEINFLREGWLDFTQRLMDFLVTGEITRYNWRREFDASIELPGTAEEVWSILFNPDKLLQWLPLNRASLEAGAMFTPRDDQNPASFQVADVIWGTSDYSTSFQLAHPDWLHPTSCKLKVSPYQDGSILSIVHVGWEAMNRNGAIQRQQRKRFSEVWVYALKRCRKLIESLSVSSVEKPPV